MVTLLRLAACSVPLLIGLTSRCFAHWARASCAPRHCHPPQFAIVALQRCRLQSSFAHWAYYGLFRALRAAFVRPTSFR